MIKQVKVLCTIFWVLAFVTHVYAADFLQGTYTSDEYTIVFADKGQFRVSTGEELVVEGEYTVKGEQLILKTTFAHVFVRSVLKLGGD